MAGSVEAWFRALPPITRWHFASVVIVTLAGNFGLVSPFALALTWDAVAKFEIWRFVTCMMFMGKLGFGFLIHLMFLYQHSQPLELHVDENGRNKGDYFFFILVCSVVLNILGLMFNFFFLGASLIMAVIYYWSRAIGEDQEVTFMFGLQFKGVYLPWVLTAFGVLMGADPKPDLAGIAAGHLYYFLKDVYPAQNGGRLLWTPMFIKQIFNAQARPANTNWNGGHNWGGGGQRLGDN